MNKLTLLTAAILSAGGLSFNIHAVESTDPSRPNFVFFFCDDLGIGDLQCYNAQGKIKTPNIDQLVKDGMIFNDAHTGSAVCTPSRYNLMTGRYCWRTDRKEGVGYGFSPSLITRDRMTVADFLKTAGYSTGIVGKWHIGMNWTLKSGKKTMDEQTVDFSKPISNGPCDNGFDYYFGIPASLDMTPYVFIENKMSTGIPTGFSPVGKTAEARARAGVALPGWKHENVLPTLTAKAIHYIQTQSAAKKPFFLYMPVNGPHTPVAPNKQWIGKSGCGLYGDFVMEIDDALGQVIKTLKASGSWENTVFILSSDNGPETLTRRYEKDYNHLSSGIYRGWKRHLWEGGHRVPYVLSWPAKVKAGSRCDSLIEVGDFMATAAQMIGKPLPDTAAEDSFSFLPYLTGRSDAVCRTFSVHHSVAGDFAIRDGDWKAIFHNEQENGPFKVKDSVQLYNMKTDCIETQNVAAQHPEIVKRLQQECLRIIESGRSTPGKSLPQNLKNWKQYQTLRSFTLSDETSRKAE